MKKKTANENIISQRPWQIYVETSDVFFTAHLKLMSTLSPQWLIDVKLCLQYNFLKLKLIQSSAFNGFKVNICIIWEPIFTVFITICAQLRWAQITAQQLVPGALNASVNNYLQQRKYFCHHKYLPLTGCPLCIFNTLYCYLITPFTNTFSIKLSGLKQYLYNQSICLVLPCSLKR